MGDGTTSAAVVDPGLGTFQASYQYADDDGVDAYTVTATLADDDGGEAVASTVVAVVNALPVLTGVSLSREVIGEGGFAALTGSFSDAGALDTHGIEVAWGDGTTSTATVDAETQTFTAIHQYLDDVSGAALRTITTTLTDDEGGVATTETSVTVKNKRPVITSLTRTPLFEDGTITLSGTFTDGGSLDTHTLTIDWERWDHVRGGDRSGGSDVQRGSHLSGEPRRVVRAGPWSSSTTTVVSS